ncbi:ATP-binding protein [Magnetococcus sp. PR-3]|uniref:ATP-binding protein n=1 Tax=Magnetococcus sp. PR-3 TaxID=3120355 RepID=UPI002FCE04EA
MAVSLDSLNRAQDARPPRITEYGVAGVGKTTLAAGAPNPVFILTEDGLGQIQATSFPLARSYGEVIGALDALLTEQHTFATVVVDSLDWLEPLIWGEVCSQQGVRSIEDIGYGKGYVFAMDLWRTYLDRLNRLRDEKNMVVIQIAHSIIKRFDSPEHDPYDRYEIKLHAKASALIQEHSDCVLFANYRVSTTKTDVGFQKKVNRAVGTGERVLFTQERPAFLAKNRYNLPPELPMDWSVLQGHLTGNAQQNA